jgi:predicted ester cyclase
MQTASASLTPELAAAIFERIREVHARHDPAGVRSVYTEDVVVDDDGGSGTVRGHAEMEQFMRTVWRAFPDFWVELVEGPYVSADGRGFAALGRLGGTMEGPLDPPGLAPTGTRVSTDFAGFYECDGDRVRRARIVMDTTDLAVQLAAVPAPGSRGERMAVRLQRLQAPLVRRRARRRPAG